MDRYAITFPIRPGTSAKVIELLSGYPTPELTADAGARLLGTTVFLHEDTVVRVLDVEGPLPVVARHLAHDPVIAQVERELNPYLVTPRDFGNPDSARRFFGNALMTPLTVRVASGQALTQSQRYALVYPIRPGTGDAADSVFLEGGDPPAAPGRPRPPLFSGRGRPAGGVGPAGWSDEAAGDGGLSQGRPRDPGVRHRRGLRRGR